MTNPYKNDPRFKDVTEQVVGGGFSILLGSPRVLLQGDAAVTAARQLAERVHAGQKRKCSTEDYIQIGRAHV